MALALKKKLLPEIVANAHSSGLITVESSSTVALYQISRRWRKLFQKATQYRSEEVPGWNEKEVEAAKIIISALLFLRMENCEDVEALITDTIKAESISTGREERHHTDEEKEGKFRVSRVK